MRVNGRAGLLLAIVLVAGIAEAQTGPQLTDRFTATTAAMTPRDVTIRIDVREWSDEASRADVVAALASESDAPKALASLPTKGYVWQSSSAVGHAVKYAHRVSTPDGERVTFVTDRRIGAYDFKPWVAEAGPTPAELGYSVIELYLNDRGSGAGTMSLAAEVQLDEANGLVGLADGAPRVLANAKLEPKGYSGSAK